MEADLVKPTIATKRQRISERRKKRSEDNEKKAESGAKTALVLGGGAPNMALMAGALAAFEDKGVTFDVVSTSGAGSLAGLLWLAPKGLPPAKALRSVMTMSVADPIYEAFPVNYKVFTKPGPFADLWRQAVAGNDAWRTNLELYQSNPTYALGMDWLNLMIAGFAPSNLQSNSWGLCAPTPFIEAIVDFDAIPKVKPELYLSAYNLTRGHMVDFDKHQITPEHFRAALAFPFIYGPYEVEGEHYYEGAVRDCLNFQDLVEKHVGLETIVVFDVLGTDALIRKPRHLYDSWVLSMIIPLVKTAEDNLKLFALEHNHGWRRQDGARADLLKVEFDVPEADLDKVLDWSASNANRLFNLGYQAGLQFAADHAEALAKGGRQLDPNG